MEKKFEGMTKSELIKLLGERGTYQFAYGCEDLECALVSDGEISVWPIYDHNDISCHYVDEFFEMFGD